MQVKLIADVTEFTALTRNALAAIGIILVDDLRLLSLRDLRRIDHIGRKGREAILDYCRTHDIALNNRNYL